MSGRTGIAPETIRRIARELAGADSAAVYGRVGVHTVVGGTVASWATDVLNTITGNLDRPGGAMWSLAGARSPEAAGRRRRGYRIGRWASRVSQRPEANGELPVGILAEEIETDGPDRIRALITIGGNPVLSTPHSDRLDAALSQLEFMASVDIYVNETTRHADVILPAPSPLQKSHYDAGYYSHAIRRIANFSPPLFPSAEPSESDVLGRLTHARRAAMDPTATAPSSTRSCSPACSARPSPTRTRTVFGRDPAELRALVQGSTAADRIVDAARPDGTLRRRLRRRRRRTDTPADARPSARHRLRPARATSARRPAAPRRARWSSHRPRSSTRSRP